MSASVAIDTNVLVRLLVRDDEAQFNAAQRLVVDAEAGGEPVLILFGVMLETEWVLRSRYRLDKASIIDAFSKLLETLGVIHEDEQALEDALSLWKKHARVDFTDCMSVARAAQRGVARFLTFDAGDALLPQAELLV